MQRERILIQAAPFSVAEEYRHLSDSHSDGAIVTFVGKVRNHNKAYQHNKEDNHAVDEIQSLHLEHYPGMTERALQEIITQARQRWSISQVTIIHRVGMLTAGEEIVFVGVSSAHRSTAFAATEFIMDYLKIQAPLWKKESTISGERWVEAKESDQQAAGRWLTNPSTEKAEKLTAIADKVKY